MQTKLTSAVRLLLVAVFMLAGVHAGDDDNHYAQHNLVSEYSRNGRSHGRQPSEFLGYYSAFSGSAVFSSEWICHIFPLSQFSSPFAIAENATTRNAATDRPLQSGRHARHPQLSAWASKRGDRAAT
jgi:hypothetical protein